jgi:ADP-dependent NAD(P)H-hydrate dehydratase / NAD(P)H-hydrate epimerase
MIAITAETMRAIEKQAIEEFGISGLQLMEAAGQRSVEVIESIASNARNRQILILAGKGNNGGDGFVIARLLQQNGWAVKTCILSERSQISGDAAVNLDRLPPGSVTFCCSEEQLQDCRDEISESAMIVDALLGTGINSNISGIYAQAIKIINGSGVPVLSVDIPSGVHASTGAILGTAVKADFTVTFAFAKMGHIFFPGASYSGDLTVSDIGIPEAVMKQVCGYVYLNPESVRPMLKPRHLQAHKGSFGHCLILAASIGKTGAAALSANSAVRCGSGLVTVAVPASLNCILEVKTTEAMTIPLEDSGQGHITEASYQQITKSLSGKDCLAVGPGIGRHPETTAVVRRLVETADIPMVIDADGLNAISIDTSILLHRRSANLVLTPHPGEMARLTGSEVPADDAGRIAVAERFAEQYKVWLILKGAHTVIAAPDGTSCINTSGNPGMASGGMGDVLTGMIASLLGQGYNTLDACRIGVFIHGLAADLVAEETGEIGITATDVIEKIPYAFKKLLEAEKR